MFRVSKLVDESFNVQMEEGTRFYPMLHYHPDIQLTLILEGRGTRFIGNSIEPFREGELYLVGSNVPHVFKTAERPGSDPVARSLSVYFRPDVLGERFLRLPETRHLSRLLSEASRGIAVGQPAPARLAEQFLQIRMLSGFERLQQLLQVLHAISVSGNYRIISDLSYDRPMKDADNRRISGVFDYVFHHYAGTITLQQAASIANMSVTAFCRYFRLHTRHTFTDFVNRTRIGQAMRLLNETDHSVSEIGYQCGYNNIPYFNREFRKIAGTTPLKFRRKFREEARSGTS
ncbi:MAG: AraC family transcriptional regulator [Bacteroidetes bacterium]|nr:MAG: AraC family transcriptional regulator [Bacteroidota bacterium]